MPLFISPYVSLAIACVTYYIILLCISALFLGESKRPFSTVRLYSVYRNFFASRRKKEMLYIRFEISIRSDILIRISPSISFDE